CSLYRARVSSRNALRCQLVSAAVNASSPVISSAMARPEPDQVGGHLDECLTAQDIPGLLQRLGIGGLRALDHHRSAVSEVDAGTAAHVRGAAAEDQLHVRVLPFVVTVRSSACQGTRSPESPFWVKILFTDE